MKNRTLSLGFAAVVLAGVTGACTEERAILTDPAAPDAFGFQLLGPPTNLPGGTIAFVGSDSLRVTLRGLDSLATGHYTAWVGDAEGTTFRRATGNLVSVRTDTTFDADGNPLGTPTTFELGNRSSFNNGGPNQEFTWGISRSVSGLDAADPMATLLITIEPTESAATPHSSRRPLWARSGEGSALRFGNYAGTALDQYLYVGAARGRAMVQERVIMGNDSSMNRPPVGYYYAMWAVKRVIGETSGWDTIFVGEQTSPWPRRHLSQFNADSIITDAAVVTDVPRAILAGSARLDADTVPGLLNTGGTAAACITHGCPFLGYNEFWLTLQPKNGVPNRMGAARVLLGSIPAVVTNGVR